MDARPLGLKLARVAFTAPDAPPPPLFEGPAIVVGAPPPAPSAPDPVAGLERRGHALDAKLDRIVNELRGIRGSAEQARASAGRVAAALDRAVGGAASDAG